MSILRYPNPKPKTTWAERLYLLATLAVAGLIVWWILRQCL